MSLARDAIKSVMLAHALPTAGLLFTVAVLAYGAAKITLRVARHNGYVAGYGQARDSVNALTIKRLAAQHARDTLRADSAAAKAKQLSAIVRDSGEAILRAPRHTPRIEALTVPVTVDTSLVGVFVENTGEHFVLPRRAALYWAASDSLVLVAQQLIKKYAAANQGWANAYIAEHEAREGADSLAALWRTRALANVTPPRNMHRIAYLALGVVAGFIAAKRIH